MYQPEQPVFDQAIESNIEITYGIEDVPKPWWKSLYFAVQITLVDFTPFVWGGMFVSLAGLDAATVLPTMISACFLVMGICTLIQTTIGNRLPIVQGPSASLASSMGSVAATYGLPAVWGSVIVGGALETLLGGARIMSKIRKFLPPVVVGSVVAAIGYVAARIAVQWTFSSQDAKSLIMAAVAFLLALVLKFRGGKGLLSQGFILITVIIVGVVGASALGVFNWEAVHNAPWFALPKLFPYTGLEGQSGSTIAFVGAAIVGGFSGYIASMFESVGDYAATCAACDGTLGLRDRRFLRRSALHQLHPEYRHHFRYRCLLPPRHSDRWRNLPGIWSVPQAGLYSFRHSAFCYRCCIPYLCRYHHVLRH